MAKEMFLTICLHLHYAILDASSKANVGKGASQVNGGNQQEEMVQKILLVHFFRFKIYFSNVYV